MAARKYRRQGQLWEDAYSLLIPVENLAANADIANRLVYKATQDLRVVRVTLLSQGTPAGIDGTNTCVVEVKNTTTGNVIATETYNAINVFPTNDQNDIAVNGAYEKVSKGDLVELSVTNGTTADPPAFVVQVDLELR